MLCQTAVHHQPKASLCARKPRQALLAALPAQAAVEDAKKQCEHGFRPRGSQALPGILAKRELCLSLTILGIPPIHWPRRMRFGIDPEDLRLGEATSTAQRLLPEP